jgi:hypothetical protein
MTRCISRPETPITFDITLLSICHKINGTSSRGVGG